MLASPSADSSSAAGGCHGNRISRQPGIVMGGQLDCTLVTQSRGARSSIWNRGSTSRSALAAASISVASTSAPTGKPTSRLVLLHRWRASSSSSHFSSSGTFEPGLCTAKIGSSASVPASPSLRLTYHAPDSIRTSLQKRAPTVAGDCMCTSCMHGASSAAASACTSVVLARAAERAAERGALTAERSATPRSTSNRVQMDIRSFGQVLEGIVMVWRCV